MVLSFIINLFFLLLVILGNSRFGSYVICIASGLLLLFSPKLISRRRIENFFSKKHFLLLFFLVLFFLLISSLSLTYTSSLSDSISRLTALLFSFLFFFFSIFIKDKYFDKKSLLLFFNLLVVSVELLVLFLIFFPKWGELIPGMNLLYLRYGHNHFAAFLLLILPLFYWQLVTYKNLFHFFIIIFSYLLIILSLSRVIILLTILEFFLIIFAFRSSFLSLQSNLKRTIFSSIGVLLIFSLLMVTLSFSKSLKIHFICDSKFGIICKNISEEGRRTYWKNSILILKDNLFIGSGLNTYQLESKKHLHYYDSMTSYAHNEFLQMFSDLGLIGGSSFLILMFYLLFLTLKIALKEHQLSIKKFLFIGLLFTYLNVLFDFDWQFISIFLLTLLFSSFILRPAKNQLIENKNLKIPIFFYYFYYLLCIILFINVLLLSISETLTFFNKEKLAFEIYPYSSYQKETFLKSEQLSDKDENRLNRIYANDPLFLVKNPRDKTLEEKLNSYSKAFRAYPLIVLSSDPLILKENLNKENYIQLKNFLFEMVDWVAEENKSGFLVPDELKMLVGNYLIAAGNIAYDDENFSYLGEVYYQYSRIFSNFTKEYNPKFLSNEADTKYFDMLISMQEFNPYLFYNNSDKFTIFYRSVADKLILDGKYKEAYELYSRMIPLFKKDEMWFGTISDFLLKESSKKIENRDSDLNIYLSSLLSFYLSNKDLYWNYFFKRDLSLKLISLANDIYKEDKFLALKYYAVAHAFDKWSLSDEKNYLSTFAEEYINLDPNFFSDSQKDSFIDCMTYFKRISSNSDLSSQVGNDFFRYLNKF